MTPEQRKFNLDHGHCAECCFAENTGMCDCGVGFNEPYEFPEKTAAKSSSSVTTFTSTKDKGRSI